MRKHLVLLLTILAVLSIGCNGKKPSGDWQAMPTKICPGETVNFRWGLTNATEARIVPSVGTIDPTSGTATDNPVAMTEYTLEAKNDDYSWMRVASKIRVNIVGPGGITFWTVSAHGTGEAHTSTTCAWEVMVPATEFSDSIIIMNVKNSHNFGLSASHILPETVGIAASGTTSVFNDLPIVGKWVFQPTNRAEFYEKINAAGYDKCEGYKISVQVYITCP